MKIGKGSLKSTRSQLGQIRQRIHSNWIEVSKEKNSKGLGQFKINQIKVVELELTKVQEKWSKGGRIGIDESS